MCKLWSLGIGEIVLSGSRRERWAYKKDLENCNLISTISFPIVIEKYKAVQVRRVHFWLFEGSDRDPRAPKCMICEPKR